MANIGRKNGIFHVRFRHAGVEYKKSLKTRDPDAARAAGHLVEVTLHRLHTGQLVVPAGTDPGDFVVRGGISSAPPARTEKTPAVPTVRVLAEQFVAAQTPLISATYLYSQAMHLRHLVKFLGPKADRPTDGITGRELDGYLQARLAERHPSTAERERITLLQFFAWAVRQNYLKESPAAGLPPIKGGDDRPPFRTIAEIERILARGGLTDAERLDVWDCLYLAPGEIAGLLAAVRANARYDYGFLLHAIPAYTGIRRGRDAPTAMGRRRCRTSGYLAVRSRKQSRRKRETVRRIPLHPELKAELAAWHARRPVGQYVIGEADGSGPISPDRANRVFWQAMRKIAWCLDNNRDLFKVGFHTYRHSFASNLAAAGVDQRVIDEMMGHTTEAMRRRYRHLFPASQRSAVESFSFVPSDPGKVLEGDTRE